jgi:hypothetical protein
MHKEEMEGGTRIKSSGTQLVRKEEIERGMIIKSRVTQPTRRKETDGGGKFGGHM